MAGQGGRRTLVRVRRQSVAERTRSPSLRLKIINKVGNKATKVAGEAAISRPGARGERKFVVGIVGVVQGIGQNSPQEPLGRLRESRESTCENKVPSGTRSRLLRKFSMHPGFHPWNRAGQRHTSGACPSARRCDLVGWPHTHHPIPPVALVSSQEAPETTCGNTRKRRLPRSLALPRAGPDEHACSLGWRMVDGTMEP